jgi:tripartite-type tricarboxylate transporter receptor subunit TctC
MGHHKQGRSIGIARRVAPALAAAILAAPAAAQTFPNKPLRFVHPFAAGSGTDVTYRPVMERLSAILGQPITTDPRPGGGSTVASLYVKSQPADGYTFYNISTTQIVRSLVPNPEVDVRKDFTPIACNTASPLVITVNTDQIKATTLKELIEDARARPGQINYASYGIGSGAHLLFEHLLYDAKASMVHVPYQGTAQAAADTVSGRTQVTATIVVTLRPFVSSLGGSGKLRMLAVSTADASPVVPGVPGLKEAGFPDIDYNLWGAFVGPLGIPRDIVEILNRAMTATYKDAKIIEMAAKSGQTVTYCTPDELARKTQREYDTLSRLMKATGLKLE